MRVGLTYRDVRKILALLDAWPCGRIHFEDGALVVDAVTNRTEASVTFLVAAPAVGTFEPAATLLSNNGSFLPAGTCIGSINTPLRSTSVVTLEDGRILSVLVRSSQFVEYGQPLIIIERLSNR